MIKNPSLMMNQKQSKFLKMNHQNINDDEDTEVPDESSSIHMTNRNIIKPNNLSELNNTSTNNIDRISNTTTSSTVQSGNRLLRDSLNIHNFSRFNTAPLKDIKIKYILF